MDNKQKALELKVGFFVFVGLAFIGAMVVQFGSVGQSFKKFYDLTVEFPNASGLIKGSDVQLAGARIGYVADKPAIANNIGGVTVRLKISDGVKIPRKMAFRIDSAGLLGDKYVDVCPNYDFDPSKFDASDPSQVLQPGEKIKGAELAGIKELMEESQPLLQEMRGAVSEIKEVAASVRGGLLSETNQKNLADSMANLKTSSENFAKASKGFEDVVVNAQGAVTDVRTVLDSARGVVNKAKNGDGVFAALLTDRELAQNLKILVLNLRERGILFYKDVPPKQPKTEQNKRR